MAFDPASSRAKYQHRREAGPAWNQNEQRKLDQQYGCGNTLYGWDGDTLAFENRTHDLGARLTHYVYEPGTFVPVARAGAPLHQVAARARLRLSLRHRA
nr:hypothetical protein [Pseudomonas sp. BIGb0427]